MIISHETSYVEFKPNTHIIEYSDPYTYTNYNPIPKRNTTICSSVYDNDRQLISMLNMEAWNMYGVKIVYYGVSYDTTYDKIWGEDGNRRVETSWNVMAYFQLPRENKVWGKFGIDGINDFSMFISKEHFRYNTNEYIPKVGDIVLATNDNKFYEVTEVKEEAPMFMLSKQYSWELICRKLKVESEISVSPQLSASPITTAYGASDILDIKADIDTKKNAIIYQNKQGEHPSKDPLFGGW